jgi:hypothetical protein
VLRRQSGLCSFGLLCDLGYASVIFSARGGGFVSVPTFYDPTPSYGSHPCRVGWRRRWYMRYSGGWTAATANKLSTSAGAATTERPVLVRLALRPRLRLGHLIGTQLRFRVRPNLRRLHAVLRLVPVQGRVEKAMAYGPPWCGTTATATGSRRALLLRRQSSLYSFGLLCDLGYGSVIFSARNGGFVSVPTCGDLTPSSGSHPCSDTTL